MKLAGATRAMRIVAAASVTAVVGLSLQAGNWTSAAGKMLRGATLGPSLAAHLPVETAAARLAAMSRCPWLDTSLPVNTRINELLAAMTPLQEATMLHLIGWNSLDPYEGYSAAIPSLCIPQIVEQDGAAGVANGYSPMADVVTSFIGATQLPAPIADAAAFDPSLARRYGNIIGSQDAAKGIDMALAPTINIDRSPLWGRSYESLGEDPYLTASLGVPLVDGIQSNRVVSVLKHFDVYNQELHRSTLKDNAIVSQRAIHEIYMPAFAAVVTQAHPGGLMCAYSLINGTPSCQNLQLLSGTLRKVWGFAGFVRSDCGSVFAQAPAMAAGVSQVKCTVLYNPSQLAAAVKDGTLSRASLDALARPLFKVLFAYDLIAAPHPLDPNAPVDSAAGAAVARLTADEGAVLLKNTGHLLPLNLHTVPSLALIGPRGGTPMPAGFGAMHVGGTRPISALSALTAVMGKRVRYATGTDIAAAAALARESKVAVVVVHDLEKEGHDRPSLVLPGKQNLLVDAVERANPNTVVVLETGSAVLTPWLARTKSLLETWYPGQEAGPSLVDLLSGAVDPSGKLPVTFPASAAAMPDNTPATWGGVNGRVLYSDNIDVGYRWYQVHGVTPAFSFGYGLSYTSFGFSNLSVQAATDGSISVDATVTNTGKVAGADVVQCYIGDPSTTGEPPRQLRGFQRVVLAPHQSAPVHFTITPGDLATWDTSANSWQVAAGTYQVWMGDGSALAQLPLNASIDVAASNLGPDSGPAPTAPAGQATPVTPSIPAEPTAALGKTPTATHQAPTAATGQTPPA